MCSRKSKEANTDEEGESQEPWSVISRGVTSSLVTPKERCGHRMESGL